MSTGELFFSSRTKKSLPLKGVVIIRDMQTSILLHFAFTKIYSSQGNVCSSKSPSFLHVQKQATKSYESHRVTQLLCMLARACEEGRQKWERQPSSHPRWDNFIRWQQEMASDMTTERVLYNLHLKKSVSST